MTRRAAAPRRQAALLLLVLAWLMVGAPVSAQQGQRGVAVDVGRIDVTDVVVPGGSYTLPPIGVRNPGEALGSYRMGFQAVASVEPGAALADASWFDFSPPSFELAANARQQVTVKMVVPDDVPTGRYEVLLTAQLTGLGGDGAHVGAAAATKLVFTVVDEPGQSLPRWLGWAAAAAAALAVVEFLRRRYSISVARR